MKHILFIAGWLLTASLIFGGELTLSECQEKARASHPLQDELSNRQHIYELARKNLNANWLPTLDVNAQALYNSDVVEFDQIMQNLTSMLPFDISMQDVSSMPNEQYQATLDIRQMIYDGGATRARKKMQTAELEADRRDIEVQLYQLDEQVQSIYLGILLLEKRQQLAELFQTELQNRLRAARAGVKNGMLLPSDLDVLRAEELKVEQQLAELNIRRTHLVKALAELIGENIAANTKFATPQVTVADTSVLARPELQLFAAQKQRLQTGLSLTKIQHRPKLFAFGSYGYGNPPGNDFFTDTFDTYYRVGAGLQWNLFDGLKTHREREQLMAQQRIVDAKEAAFRQRIQTALEQQRAELESYRHLLQTDDKLIILRENIADAAASKLDNGAISATEYLTELHAERQARLDKHVHELLLTKAKININHLTGQLESEQ